MTIIVWTGIKVLYEFKFFIFTIVLRILRANKRIQPQIIQFISSFVRFSDW